MSKDYDYGDYNRGGMWAFIFSIFITLIFFIYVAFIHSGVDLKEMDQSPSKSENPADPNKSEQKKTDSSTNQD